MSNRRRPKAHKERKRNLMKMLRGETVPQQVPEGFEDTSGLNEESRFEVLDSPTGEKEVLKTVPSIIHWANVPQVDREDSETVGKAVIYIDGSFDMIVFEGISEEARDYMDDFQASMFRMERSDDGPS